MQAPRVYDEREWPYVLALLPGDLAESAKREGALRRRRNVPDAAALMRMALAYAVSDLSLKDVAAWAPTSLEATSSSDGAILEVRDLKVHFPVKRGFIFQRSVGAIKAVDGVTFAVRPGETLGLVGESGSGKTTTGRAIIQLTRPTGGQVLFEGQDLSSLRGGALRRMRRRLGFIFQDPYGSLNPRMTAGNIVGEPLAVHKLYGSKQEYRDQVNDLFETVGLNRAMASRYPHEFSGGQRQRVGVARAIAAHPGFIVCDEPVSALDVSIQAQIINLLEDLQKQYGIAYLFSSRTTSPSSST
jgi:oligopeptide transport system ATP-binding protein